MFIVGISLAISAIPTGLPAVVTMLLSMGTRDLATKGAIVKRLRSVETLGLDIGDLFGQDRHADVEPDDRAPARAWSAAGSTSTARATRRKATSCAPHGNSDGPLEPYLLPMALANDAVIRDGACIGDPTEGALVVLAAKGGLDVTRRAALSLVSARFRSMPSTS